MKTKVKVNKTESSSVFPNKFDETPHTNSQHHSSINFKLVCNFDQFCNKLFEIMMPFNWDKVRPRLTVRTETRLSHGYFTLELLSPV